jgi:DNA-binding winged helix-turn-helix (wHTH) protein
MEPLRHVFVVRFGTYEVSFQSGEVRKAGVRIRVQQQPLKLLEVLLERPGEVVTREELRSRVWPTKVLVISTRRSTLPLLSSGAR